MAIRWEEITHDNLNYIEEVLALYDQSFPIDLREPHDVILRGLDYAKNAFPNDFCIVIGMEDDQLVSFATGHYLAESNAGFIVYISTNPLARNQGLGSKTLRKMEERFHQSATIAGHSELDAVILETEKVEDAHTAEEKEECVRRTRFFNKNQYHPVHSIQYVQPPLYEGEHDVPLHLFIKKVGDKEMADQKIKQMVQEIYKEKYASVNQISSRVLNGCLEKMGLNKQ